jgi:uncharacterized protein (DUF983 family)
MNPYKKLIDFLDDGIYHSCTKCGNFEYFIENNIPICSECGEVLLEKKFQTKKPHKKLKKMRKEKI